jgi:lipid-binding SYLF domain-containing protein
LVLLFGIGSTTAHAGEKHQKTRDGIDAMQSEVMEKLFTERAHALELFDKSYGYAVFNNLKVSLMLASGRGKGVAVNKETNERTYMKMGSVGVNVGYGIKKVQVVILFQTKAAFDNFVEKGWQADAGADIALAKKGTEVGLEFRNGVAAYEFAEKGLML